MSLVETNDQPSLRDFLARAEPMLPVKTSPLDYAPALGRGASAAIGGASERFGEAIRAEIQQLAELVRQADEQAEALIDEMTRRSLALQEQIEGYAKQAHAVQGAIRQAGKAES